MQHPSSYEGAQIIQKSDQLVLIGLKDAIFLNANTTISLAANETVNVDTGKHFIVNAPKIYLTKESIDETQPAVRGNDMKDVVLQLVNSLEKLIQVTEKTPGDMPTALVLGLGFVKASIENVKEAYGKDLNKTLSTKIFVA